MSPQQLSLSLLSLAYKDYIAARFLLNNNYPMQGLTLASSAVEKYFKVILAINNKKKKVHLDRLEELKKEIEECYIDVTKHLDSKFLNLLGEAYKARYYDNLTSPITIGFFINEVLGELDYTVRFFEHIITLKNEEGVVFKSSYKRAEDSNNEDLYLNNYILNNMLKKEFMEQADEGFAVHIDANNFRELIVEGRNILKPYTGSLTGIQIKFK